MNFSSQHNLSLQPSSFRLLFIGSLLLASSQILAQTPANVGPKPVSDNSGSVLSVQDWPTRDFRAGENYARYSDQHIQVLNQRKAVPKRADALQAEIDRLQVQQRRFNRQYGADSVAARSVRHRLFQLINETTSSEYRYAQTNPEVRPANTRYEK